MKPISSLRFTRDNNTLFSVHFDDGMTLVLRQQDDDTFEYMYMLSTGPGSYFLKKNKWPAGENLQNRIQASTQYVMRNIKNNRYKIKK